MSNPSLREVCFFCPHCRKITDMAPSRRRCPHCGAHLVEEGGIFNFVQDTTKGLEKGFYDGEYSKLVTNQRRVKPKDMQSIWERIDMPENHSLREAVGDVSGKTVLLLGNGSSNKELFFLEAKPWRLVYSDLSPFASRSVQSRLDFSGHEENIRFAAVDAEQLPFVDGTFDIVYGYAMVHHLPNVEKFLDGVFRVLKSGGTAVFMDDAYSPIWHYSKQTWLSRLMKHSHKKTGISPEDYRFSMSGGFKEPELERLIKGVGGDPFFQRESLLTYIWVRGVEKILPHALSNRLRRSWVVHMLVMVDRWLGRFRSYQNNQIRLIWGFKKS